MLSLITAVAENNIIGNSANATNGLPWHLPDELKYFRDTTRGKPVIMGRKTHEAIGRLLPGRENIILTSQPNYAVEGATICSSLQEAIKQIHNQHAFVIGGANVYRQALEQGIVDEIYITRVHADMEGDVEFPVLRLNDWELKHSEHHQQDEHHEQSFTMEKYNKVKAA